MINRGELVRVVADYTGLPIITCEKVVGELIEAMIEAMEAGEEVRLKGFGRFELRQRQAVMRRNPKTGEEMFIDARSTVAFFPGDVLRRRLNRRVDAPRPTWHTVQTRIYGLPDQVRRVTRARGG